MKDSIKIPLYSPAARQILQHRACTTFDTNINLDLDWAVLKNSINEYTTISTNYKEMLEALDAETFLKVAPVKMPKEYIRKKSVKKSIENDYTDCIAEHLEEQDERERKAGNPLYQPLTGKKKEEFEQQMKNFKITQEAEEEEDDEEDTIIPPPTFLYDDKKEREDTDGNN